MSARAGEEIPKNESKPIQSTPPLASGSEGERRTGINWREVLGRSPRKVAETSYAQAKEQTQRKEAEVSPEALELAKDNFGELVYLLLKEPNFLKNTRVRELIVQLSPELGKLFDPSFLTSLSADEVVRKIQQEIGMVFSDSDSLSEQEKRIREAHRQQVVIIGLTFQEYKMQAITNAYNISINEEKPELSTEEEQLTQEAKQKLRRPENVLVLDEEGRIIPQGPELSEEEYVEACYRQMPVSILRRIFGKTEEVQRRKAAEEYQRYRKLIEEQEGKKPGECRLRIKIKEETQPKRDPNHEFLLEELGLMSENKLKAEDVVLPEIMAQIRAALTLRQEILTATGISGEQLFAALKNLSPTLPMIPSLDKLETDSLNIRIKEIIEQRRTENAKRVKEDLEKTERQSTISQLKIKERELDERLREIEKEAQEKGTEEKTQPAEGGQESLVELIEDAIRARLEVMEISELLRQLEQEQKPDIGRLLQRSDYLSLQIAGLEAELEERREDFKRLENLRAELGHYRRMAATKSITYGQGENAQTHIIDQGVYMDMIGKIEGEIQALANGQSGDGLDIKKKKLAELKNQKAVLDNFLNIEISINGETKKAREWLRELERLRSITSTPTEIFPPEEASSKEEVETELYAVRALIGYYSENALSEREERILQTKDLKPNYVFTEDHLTAIASRNPELYDLLPKKEEGKIDIDKAKIVLLVLYQAFGDKFIYPDDPNAPELRGIITILHAIKDLGEITSIEDFDEKMRELVNEYLLKKRSLGSKIEQKETKSEKSQESTSPQPAPT